MYPRLKPLSLVSAMFFSLSSPPLAAETFDGSVLAQVSPAEVLPISLPDLAGSPTPISPEVLSPGLFISQTAVEVEGNPGMGTSSLSPIAAPVPQGSLTPIEASPNPSLSPAQVSIPSLAPILNTSPNPSSVPSLSNNDRSVLSIEIPCQNLVENLQQKLAACEKMLAIHRQIGDRSGEGATLNNMALVYQQQGRSDRALSSYQQALEIQEKLGNRAGVGATFNNIGLVYHELGEYARALNFYQQALAINRELGNRLGEGRTLNNLGELHRQLGEYSQAQAFYQQALKVENDRLNIGNTLHNIGLLHDWQGDNSQALKFYHEALAIRQEIGDKLGEGTTLNNMGLVYDRLGQHSQALDSLQQALAIFKQLDNRASIGNTLDSIGTVYKSFGKYFQSLESYQQALAILREVGNRGLERVTLSNIGNLLDRQNQPALAILFYKQSINLTELIRKDLRSLPREQQESYTKTVADTYRSLADLLLKQNRVLEAQQVLDLLKVQELEDYLSNVRGNEQTSQGVELLPPEQKIATDYTTLQDKAIQLGKELTALRNIPEANRTPAQQQRLAEIVKNQELMTAEFNNFIRSPEVTAQLEQLSPTARDRTVSLRRLKNIQDNLQRLGQGTVLLYPLILADRLELILTTPDTPPIRRTVAVKREDLNRAIAEFRLALQNPNIDAKPAAQKLYDWLIKPLENDLNQAEAKTLVYAPDAQLRYIPLAALHDGKQWLVERFSINHITADSLTDFNTKPQVKPRALAAGFSSGNYNFQVGDRQFSFRGLSFAAREVESVAAAIPNSTKLLDRDFSRDATIPRLNDYNIVHLATHAAFMIGKPDDSFILFGNGDRVTLRDVETWRLTNVDLVVLSACETGLGGQLGNGEEILGFGYLMQEAGAKAAIASLWLVDDGGTQTLMDAFYATLQKENITKAEALRQAQIALITSNDKARGEQRGIAVQARSGNIPNNVSDRLSHPFYWAPFILIGNGL